MATKNDGTVAGGNDDQSAQQKVQLDAAAEDAKTAEAAAKVDEEVKDAHDNKTVADEAQAQGALLGVDGKTAVSFYNPAPKAVVDRDRTGEVTYEK